MLAKQMAKAEKPMEEEKPTEEEVMAEEESAQEESAETGEDTGEDLSAQDEEAIERVKIAAGKVLYGKETHADVMKTLKDGADNPPRAMAETAFNLVRVLDQKAEGKIPEIALVGGVIQVLELIAELGEAAGLFQVDEQVMGQAVQNLMAIAIEQGVIDPAEVEGMMAGMPQEEVQQMVAQQQQIAQGGQSGITG